MTDLFIIIPHYGDEEPLRKCLSSIHGLAWAGGKISLGDTETSPIIVNSNPPLKRMLFTEAVNTGLREARKRRNRVNRCMYWILNSDTEVNSDAAFCARRCFDAEGWDKCGIVGSRCLKLGDPDRIVWGGSLQCYPAGAHKSGSVSAGDLRIRTEEEWASFCSVFINADLVEEIGLLDKTLEHICSDSDYCFRARAAGWKVFYEPTSTVLHAVGSSHYTTDAWLAQVKHRDIQRFKDKWITGKLFRKLTVYDVKNGR